MSYYTMNLLFFIHSYKNPLSILAQFENLGAQFENLGELVKNTAQFENLGELVKNTIFVA